ncbi:MAG: thiolase family protein [Candidatus Eremiobacteraeota bacterium]|nr:thiolase family protein [Candidatus Eremiobacteraeota bacterium]
MQGREVWVVDAVRTPIGRCNGMLADVRPDDLAAIVIRALVDRTQISPDRIDDVYWGAANQSGEDNRNVARMAALLAGLPIEVAGVTLNRLCGSSLEAVNAAARAIACDECDAAIAGGSESMTRAPYILPKSDRPYGRAQRLFDSVLGWRMVNANMPAQWTVSLGETAENVAREYGIAREEQDRFALESQVRANAAIGQRSFDDEVIPVNGVSSDEHPRPETTLQTLAALKPAFVKSGTVTAGNSSGINDGAAALLLVEASVARALHMHPLARVVCGAVAGVRPDVMGLGPIPAVRKALARASLSAGDLDLVELNEAFASQSIACMRELELDPRKTNVNGGAIALGHPLGASGARIATTLLHELRRRKGRYGLATMCIGVGQGIATIFERTENS